MKDSRAVLTSVLHTAQMGISGIEAVRHRAVKSRLQTLLQEQLQQYSTIAEESKHLAETKGWTLPKRNMLVDKMSCIGAKCRLMAGDTDSAIAGMLIQGNTRGMILGEKNLHQAVQLDPAVSDIANKLLNLENINIQKSRDFL